MAAKIIMFAQQRSGGSYVSQILSNGLPILSEPRLPDDGFLTSLTENVNIYNAFQTKAADYQVIKLCNFESFLKMMADRKGNLPTGYKPVCLFRHPYQQIASFLFRFQQWDDPWTPREYFWDAIAAYRDHFRLCKQIKNNIPATIFVKYEDALGDLLQPFLTNVYNPTVAAAIMPYALDAQTKNFALGPNPVGDGWAPTTNGLLKKEIVWIYEKLGDVMGVLGYGR